VESKQGATGYTVEGQVNLMMSWPLEWFTDREKLTAAGRHFYSIGLAESQARVEVLQKALEELDRRLLHLRVMALDLIENHKEAANDGEDFDTGCVRAAKKILDATFESALKSVSEGEKGVS
jgi:hypothetical protein